MANTGHVRFDQITESVIIRCYNTVPHYVIQGVTEQTTAIQYVTIQ